MSGKTIIQRGDEILLNIKVKPNSNCFRILGINDWDKRLHIKLKSPAKDNQANVELLEKLGKFLDKNIKLFSGKTSRKKTILIKNVNKGWLQNKLGL